MPAAEPDGAAVGDALRVVQRIACPGRAAPLIDGKGREITAQDFIYSWKRLADPRNASEGFLIFDGKIKGLNEWAQMVKAEKANSDTPVEGLTATDSNTLVVKLTGVYHQLPFVLAMPFASIVPKEAVEKYGKEFLNNPVGTGPFVLEKPTDWVRNSKITLKKNPSYRPATYPTERAPGDAEKGLLPDAGKQVPFIDKLVFNEIVEDQPRWQNGLKGNFDWFDIPKDNFENAVKDSHSHATQRSHAYQHPVTKTSGNADHTFTHEHPITNRHNTPNGHTTPHPDTCTLTNRHQYPASGN